MKNIFVFDEHLSSKFNGVGAFMNAISSCVKKSNMQLNLISFNEEVTDFCIEKHDGHVIYKYPMYGGLFIENALPALSILKLYVNDSHENIFLSSYCPSHILLNLNGFLLSTIKDGHRLCKETVNYTRKY